MTKPDPTALFTGALSVWNRMLEEHGDTTPYKQTIDACQKLLGDRKMAVIVYDDDPDEPTAKFTVRFENRQLKPVAYDEAAGEPVWRVSEDYLTKVMENAAEYIEHPEKSEWDWLKDRLGVGV
jgi:hypothetical protein